MKGILGADNLSVVYNKGTSAESIALHNVSFFAQPEEFIVIFGPSGCGKSTLLYTLTGIERHIESGDVWLDGKNVALMGPPELLALHRRDVGMIFQSYNLISTLDVLHNVTLPLLAAGVPDRERQKQAEVLLERFRIEHLADRYPSQLSGGQQQRVAIARALVTDPGIIVADEPTGNLDSQSAEIVLEQLLELNVRDKKTILLVTHDPSFLSYADRVLSMKDGTIIKIDEKKGERHISGFSPQAAIPVSDDRFGTSPFDAERKGELSFEELSRIAPVAEFTAYVSKEKERVLLLRLRNILSEIALGKLSHKDALVVLEKPVPQGGVGYSSEYAMNVLVELDEFLELWRWLMACPPNDRFASASQIHIIRWLLGIHFGEVSSIQNDLLERVILEYLSEHMDRSKFMYALEASPEQGGVGLLGLDTGRFVEKLTLIRDLMPVNTMRSG